MKVEPQRAPVKPRVIGEDGSSVSLENEILPFVFRRRGAIAILGPRGSGKTTALCHLACLAPDEEHVSFLDEPEFGVLQARQYQRVAVYSARTAHDIKHLATFTLAPWTTDDLIEYLLAFHRDKCASVMKRVTDAEGAPLLEGCPALWRVVLDEMAADEALTKLGDALLVFLHRNFDREQFAQIAAGALARILLTKAVQERTQSFFGEGPKAPVLDLEKWHATIAKIVSDPRALGLVRHLPVQALLARELIAADLRIKADCPYLVFRLTRAMVRMIAALVREDGAALDCLRGLLKKPDLQAMAASILYAADASWELPAERINLGGAYLERARWHLANLSGAKLCGADFSYAKLEGAVLHHSDLALANLRHADLWRATLDCAALNSANLSHANLSHVHAPSAVFKAANLAGADLDGAAFRGCDFLKANLEGVSARRAVLAASDLREAKLAEADFSNADFNGANLSQLRLRSACFKGASFARADLRVCDMEFMELPGADFTGANLGGALLTGTFIPGGNFQGANLSCAALAEIEWERADLKNADLRGATFHMGSTRAGLVFSPIASEGSRTGFYTDEYEEQHFKAPEQIRKANLRGADLRGAKIDNVDFYLVDLRDALYDAEQEAHLRRCRAILESRVS